MEFFIDESYARARKHAKLVTASFIGFTVAVLFITSFYLYLRYSRFVEAAMHAQQEVAQLADAPMRLKKAEDEARDLIVREQKFNKRFSIKHHTLTSLLTLLSERMADDVIISELTFNAHAFHIIGTASHMHSINELVQVLQNAHLFSSVEVVSLERLVQPSASLVFTIHLNE